MASAVRLAALEGDLAGQYLGSGAISLLMADGHRRS